MVLVLLIILTQSIAITESMLKFSQRNALTFDLKEIERIKYITSA